MAGLFLALWTPLVVLAPLAGLVVDRREARGVLLAASPAQMAVAAALVLAVDSVAAIIALAALLGTGFAFAQPAEFSLVPVVAGGRRLTEVNGLVETARYSGMTAGPLLGGVLAGVGGTEAAMLVNAVPRPHAGHRDERPVRDAAVHDGVRDRRGVLPEGGPRCLGRALRRDLRRLDRGHGVRRAGRCPQGGGILVTTIGARTTLALAGGVSVIVALAGLALYRGPAPVVELEPAR